jgi:hypothetical protein
MRASFLSKDLTMSHLTPTRSHHTVIQDLTTILHKLGILYAAEAAPQTPIEDILAIETLLAIEQLPIKKRTVPHLAANLGLHQDPLTHILIRLKEKEFLVTTSKHLLLTSNGMAKAAENKETSHHLLIGLRKLKGTTLTDLYRLTTSLLQERIHNQMLNHEPICTHCRYYQPNAHPHSIRPHHCHLIDKAFGHNTNESTPRPLLSIAKGLSPHNTTTNK